ncbi:MAG: HNH endonuclease [Alphaproteobacteria bacterium]|nr:HNH endonuclease [Alphaproteobacteria bacterium]MDA8004711.1 HNH endonuclease [Alphaproteobacteria bacterium]MDA8005266.1 HNH endonuclease [Alphaproteobacteria bacterium]MDA8012685.1 HNH endonuclease [Alphaproteobacteria bacterium]
MTARGLEISPMQIAVRDLVEGYVNDDEDGVFGYGGRLNIRPPYQREFIYGEKEQKAVIHSILNGHPINVIYWTVEDDGSHEMLDGQQRTTSICKFHDGDFEIEVNPHNLGAKGEVLWFHQLPDDLQEKILDYKLMIYLCRGSASMKKAWFKTINTPKKDLRPQELRNTLHHGPFITAARKKFSKTNCAAYNLGRKYLSGSPIRQDYLETALDWISGGDIDRYMKDNQKRPDADELWEYFQNVIEWVQTTFPAYREEMKGLPWGLFYNQFKDSDLDPAALETKISSTMMDEKVTEKAGVYRYVLTGEDDDLYKRAFSKKIKREVYEKQKGLCPRCGEKFDLKEMQADHIKPWSKGGDTVKSNCQMLCRRCNSRKSNK